MALIRAVSRSLAAKAHDKPEPDHMVHRRNLSAQEKWSVVYLLVSRQREHWWASLGWELCFCALERHGSLIEENRCEATNDSPTQHRRNESITSLAGTRSYMDLAEFSPDDALIAGFSNSPQHYARSFRDKPVHRAWHTICTPMVAVFGPAITA